MTVRGASVTIAVAVGTASYSAVAAMGWPTPVVVATTIAVMFGASLLIARLAMAFRVRSGMRPPGGET